METNVDDSPLQTPNERTRLTRCRALSAVLIGLAFLSLTTVGWGAELTLAPGRQASGGKRAAAGICIRCLATRQIRTRYSEYQE